VISRRKASAADRQAGWALVRRLVLFGLIVWLVFTFGLLITQVHGQGMFPAMKDGDLCIVFRTPAMRLVGETLEQGDVIAYTHEGKRYFARVVAVADDEVNLNSNGGVTVNGAAEPGEILFPTYDSGTLTYPLTVTEGCLYVLGDYRTRADDSRDHGLIPLDQVDGKVLTLVRRREL
jgi:signal peptidase I